MGQNAQIGRWPRGVIKLDWMLLAVGAIAVLLLVGTTFRITTGDDGVRTVRDRFTLREGDNLLAFQDFTFGADGWSPQLTSSRLRGIGPVLGPFRDEPVRRAFELPVGADAVFVEFNVHMLGTWEEEDTFTIALGELGILTLLPSGPDPSAILADGPLIAVDRRVITPQPTETDLPGTTAAFVSHTIRIAMEDPGESLVLRLRAAVAGGGSWTLDNLTVVATSGDGRRQDVP